MNIALDPHERDLILAVRNARCLFNGNEWETLVRGEIVLRRSAGSDGRLELIRLGLVGPSPKEPDHGVHKVSICSYLGTGTISGSPQDLTSSFSLLCSDVSFFDTSAGCDDINIKERSLRGGLDGHFEVAIGNDGSVILDQGVLNLASEPIQGVALFALTIDFAGSQMMFLPSPPQTIKRTLKLQPVQFTTNGSNPTGATWTDHLSKARAVWGECCLFFDPQPMITVDNNPTASASTDRCTLIRAIVPPDSIPHDAIPVFYVNSPLPGDGGGLTELSRSGMDAVYISNQADATVLAHELGHVFGGDHPTNPIMKKSYWKGDPKTILMVGGGNGSPLGNSAHNCERANHCLLSTGSPCVVNPSVTRTS
jgi:hypothetical protein